MRGTVDRLTLKKIVDETNQREKERELEKEKSTENSGPRSPSPALPRVTVVVKPTPIR